MSKNMRGVAYRAVGGAKQHGRGVLRMRSSPPAPARVPNLRICPVAAAVRRALQEMRNEY